MMPRWIFPARIATPMHRAIGIEARIVKRPQGLSARAFTTTNPRTARMITMMETTPTRVTTPAKGPTSSETICPRLFPRRREEQKRMMQSWTAPPRVAPISIQRAPGR